MLLFFWIITIFLTLLAVLFFLPWIGSQKNGPQSWGLGFFITLIFCAIVYGLYFHWGSSSLLEAYYSMEVKNKDAKQVELRRLMTEFKKQEYRLRLQLAEDPEDKEAEWRLLDLLGIKALLESDRTLAKQYWEEALKKAPKEMESVLLQKIKSLKTI